MKIKKIIILVLVFVLMCGCTKQYTCTKESVTDEFDYSIEMNLTFSNNKIKKVNSDISYRLTDEGYKQVDTLEETLQNRNDNYSIDKVVSFDFKIENKLVNIYEKIDFSNVNSDEREKVLGYSDLSIVYFNSKYKTNEVIEELKNNNFTCELK